MKVNIVPVTSFEQNSSIIMCDKTKLAVVVDPGGDLDRILAAAEKLGARIDQIWLTHGHLDHAGGAGELAEQLKIEIRILGKNLTACLM